MNEGDLRELERRSRRVGWATVVVALGIGVGCFALLAVDALARSAGACGDVLIAVYIAAVALVTLLVLWRLPRRLALRVATVTILLQVGLAVLGVVLLATAPTSSRGCTKTESLFFNATAVVALVMVGVAAAAVTTSVTGARIPAVTPASSGAQSSPAVAAKWT